MIENYIIVRDYETGSVKPKTAQILELSACVIDVRSLTLVPDATFNSLIAPASEEDMLKFGLDPLEDKALSKNNLSREKLKDAPSAKAVWQDYTNWTKKFRKGSNIWRYPHVAGFNSSGFDDIIDVQCCERYGPKLNARGDLPIYHPVKFDILPIVHNMFPCVKLNDSNSMSMDSIREYFGIDTEHAHRALKDVLDCAFIMIKFWRLMKNLECGDIEIAKGQRVRFKNSFTNENILIKDILANAKI